MNSCSTYTRFSWLDILQTNHPYKKKNKQKGRISRFLQLGQTLKRPTIYMLINLAVKEKSLNPPQASFDMFF